MLQPSRPVHDDGGSAGCDDAPPLLCLPAFLAVLRRLPGAGSVVLCPLHDLARSAERCLEAFASLSPEVKEARSSGAAEGKMVLLAYYDRPQPSKVNVNRTYALYKLRCTFSVSNLEK
jgi:hypothetical protein